MKYQAGETGRVVVARFEDGDDLLAGLAEIVKRENIRAASFHLVGGLRRGRFVTGPATEEMPPVPVWSQLDESHEVFGFGTIFWQGEEPKVHFHGAFAKRDTVRSGCLREWSEVFLVMEAVITEIRGVSAVRELDAATGFSLLRL